jgi:DMSO reductase anchor subunit
LKPACAAACLGGALDFGIIESTPENREQIKEALPGFPTPEITHPNVRFQQTRSLPREMTRPDSMPLKYMRDEQGLGQYKSKPLLEKDNKPMQWNLKKLRSREDPLVIFTLITQAVIGAFALMFVAPWMGLLDISTQFPKTYAALLFAMLALETYALVISTMHLGKPQRFYRAFNNLRYSPVSREVAAVAVFFNALGAYAVLHTFPGILTWLFPQALVSGLTSVAAWVALLVGPLAIYAMHKIYRIQARPYWNHWQVLTSFYGSALALGGTLVALVYASAAALSASVTAADHAFIAYLGVAALLGIAAELIGLYAHSRYLTTSSGEAIAAHYEQTGRFGKTYWARNLGLLVSLAGLLTLALLAHAGVIPLYAWYAAAALLLLSALLGRALFYVMVVPTTMPGAFFWKNKGFQEHAREIGLAQMPQVGVVPDTH